jgi:hypothetical protein
MNAAELCETLKIEQHELEKWCGRGLPFHLVDAEKDFAPEEVRRWLIEEGIAKDCIVATQAEVAAYFHVHRATPAKWFSVGCPGAPGVYDLVQIHQWRKSQESDAAPVLSDDERFEMDMMLYEMMQEDRRRERSRKAPARCHQNRRGRIKEKARNPSR